MPKDDELLNRTCDLFESEAAAGPPSRALEMRRKGVRDRDRRNRICNHICNRICNRICNHI